MTKIIAVIGEMVKLREMVEILRSLVPTRLEATIGGVTGVFGGLITALYGEWTHALDVLLIAMTIDYLTGVLAAAISPYKKIDYKVGMKGIAKKATILLIVAMGHLADEVLNTDIIMAAVTYAYLANEGLSIIENAGVAGVPVPNVVKMAYQTISEKGDIRIGGDSHGAKKS